MKLISSFIFITVLFAYSSVFSPALAAPTVPNFPVCSNPSGSLKVQYSSGIHGIAGDTNQFKGSDAVYSLSDGNALQCFCDNQGRGIQTNWWKVGQILSDELDSLESQGWLFIPTGAAWGLDPVSYLAKNMNYSCQGNDSSGVNGTSASASQGQVLGISTGSVLGLASTGSFQSIISMLFFGLGLITLGIYLRRKFYS